MERTYQKIGLVNVIVLLLVSAAGFAIAQYSQSFSGQVAVAFIALGFLAAAVSYFRMRLEEREQLEKMEFDELTKSARDSALFTTGESGTLLARRSREQFEKYFVPVFTAILFLLQGGGALWLWRWLAPLTRDQLVPLKEPMIAISVFGLLGLILFLLGKYSTSLARLPNQRLLRPSASYLLLGAYLCAVVALSLAAVKAGFKAVDLYAARALVLLLGLLAVENLINLVLEIYRPRIKGKVDRALYESRLVGLLGQPEGLITTAAQALDYQFGFKVSETWFYRFLEKSLGWLVLLQAAALFVSTAFVFIQAGEAALLERFGQRVVGREVLGPGLHLKWPWPIEQVYRYPKEQIQSINIGFVPDPAREKEKTVLWTVGHTKEEFNLLVAHRDPSGAATPSTRGGKQSLPASLLTVSVPVQFHVRDLAAWAYHHEDATNLLEQLATRELVRYLVSANLHEIMSRGRLEAGEILRQRIQAAVDEKQLGAQIIFVGLQDIHPPVKVAPAYEKVVAATHSKRARILAAEAESIKTNTLAGAQAFRIVNEAEADRKRRQVNALARAALFTNQIPAFAASPSVYARRAYLQMFSRATADARKYVLAVTNADEIILLNLEDRIRRDLTDFDLSPKK